MGVEDGERVAWRGAFTASAHVTGSLPLLHPRLRTDPPNSLSHLVPSGLRCQKMERGPRPLDPVLGKTRSSRCNLKRGVHISQRTPDDLYAEQVCL